jgi:4-hydroxy-tetrahydrodipicolinate synthase
VTFTTFVIAITAFTDSGELDEHGLRNHYARLREAGIGVYVAGSGSGEAYSLPDTDRRRVLEIAREELQGHVPVRGMGKEPRTTEEMIEFAEAVKSAGLDAMQVYSLDLGHGVVPSPAEIERYLEDVLSHVDVPAVLSTHAFSGYLVPIEVLKSVVARHSHVIGINCTVPDVTGLPYLVELIDTFGGRLDIHVGGPMQALTVMALGGTGYLSAEANLVPKLCVSIVDHQNRGELAAAQQAFGKLIRVFAINRFSGPKGLKAALEAYRLPGGPSPRLPRLAVTEDERRAIKSALDELRLDELC